MITPWSCQADRASATHCMPRVPTNHKGITPSLPASGLSYEASQCSKHIQKATCSLAVATIGNAPCSSGVPFSCGKKSGFTPACVSPTVVIKIAGRTEWKRRGEEGRLKIVGFNQVYWEHLDRNDHQCLIRPGFKGMLSALFLFGAAECPGGCRNGGFCNERRVCECPDGFYGPHCEKGERGS